MIAYIRLPKLGANITEGVVGAWRKRAGDVVRAGDPLVEIITSKATFDVESPAEGVLRNPLAPEKSTVPIGYVLALVADADEPLPDVTAENARLLAEFRGQAQAAARAGEGAPGRTVRATPGARRRAKEAGVDLAAIPLPPGRDVLNEEDVRLFLEQRRGS